MKPPCFIFRNCKKTSTIILERGGWGWFGGSRIREIIYGLQKQRKKCLDIVDYSAMGSETQRKPAIPESALQTLPAVQEYFCVQRLATCNQREKHVPLLLTSRCRFLLKKTAFVQEVGKFPKFYITHTF
jgi:hypothetical protein